MQISGTQEKGFHCEPVVAVSSGIFHTIPSVVTHKMKALNFDLNQPDHSRCFAVISALFGAIALYSDAFFSWNKVGIRLATEQQLDWALVFSYSHRLQLAPCTFLLS